MRARLLLGAFVAIGLAALLAGCGTSFRAPVAVVGHTPITEAQLQDEVRIAGLGPEDTTPGAETSTQEAQRKLTVRQALVTLIELRILERYAATHGVAVTPAEVSAEVGRIVQQLGGRQAFLQALRQQGLSQADARTIARRRVLGDQVGTAVAEREVHLPATAPAQQRQEAFRRWLVAQLAGSDIQVNPRFGRLIPAQGRIVPIESTSA